MVSNESSKHTCLLLRGLSGKGRRHTAPRSLQREACEGKINDNPPPPAAMLMCQRAQGHGRRRGRGSSTLWRGAGGRLSFIFSFPGCGFGHADPLTQLWATHAHMSCLSEPLGRSVLHARGLPYATPMRRYRGGRLPELSPFLRGFTWLGSVACLGSAQLDTLGSALQCRWVLTSRQSTRACYFAACRAWADVIPRPGAWSERRLRFGHADPLSELGATHAHMSGLSEPMGRSVLHARGLPYATPMRRPCDAHATPMRRLFFTGNFAFAFFEVECNSLCCRRRADSL